MDFYRLCSNSFMDQRVPATTDKQIRKLPCHNPSRTIVQENELKLPVLAICETSGKQSSDRISLLNLLKLCIKEKNVTRVRKIHAGIIQNKLIMHDIYVANALLTTYVKCGALNEAEELLKQLPTRNVVSWTALISGCVQHGLGDEALRCFKQMQDEGVSPDPVTYICILKACTIVGSLEIGQKIDADIRKQGLLQRDVVLGNTLVDMYCKCGSLEKAQEVFDQLPLRDVVSWNVLMTGYTQYGLGNEALNWFRQMEDEGISPDAITYICALKSCGIVGSLEIGEDIHARIRKQGLLRKDIILGNTLLDMYAKCGALNKARQAFEQLPVRDVVSWNVLMAGYAQHGHGQEVLQCYHKMQRDEVHPDQITYLCTLKACGIVGSLEIGEKIDTKIREQGLFQKDIALGNALVDMYAKCGALEKAQEAFEQLPMQNVVSWTALIAGYVQHGYCREALKCFKQMQDQGVSPNAVTYIFMLKACMTMKSLVIGESIDCMIRKHDLLQKDITLGNALLDMYAKCGALEKAREVFIQLPARNILAWNTLMGGYSENGFINEILECFKQIQDEGIVPDVVTYIHVLKACSITGSLRIGEEIDSEVRKQGLLQTDVVLGNTLVDMYAKCGAFKKAQEVLNQLPEKNVVSWTSLIAGYVHHGLGEEAISCFMQMGKDGVFPNAVTYSCALKACGIVGYLDVGENINAKIRSKGLLGKDVVLGNTLVDMYSKCGALEKAHKVFQELPVRDAVSWTALMTGYAQIGEANVVLSLYRNMRTEGLAPDLVTFLILLNACSHAGLLSEGERLFEEMCGVHCFTPNLEHYTCMIDLFGRAGHFNKAKDFLSMVSYCDRLPLFLAIMGACHKWLNIKLGRWAFEQSVLLNEKCSAAYVCMENIYVAAGIETEAYKIEACRVKDTECKISALVFLQRNSSVGDSLVPH